MVALLMLWLRRKTSRSLRAAILGLCAGLFFGLSATFAIPVIQDLHDGIANAAADWRTWALLGFGFLAFLIQQLSLATGQLAPAMAAVSVSNPAISVILGILLFEERLTRPAWHVVVAGAALLVALEERCSSPWPTARRRCRARRRAPTTLSTTRRSLDLLASPSDDAPDEQGRPDDDGGGQKDRSGMPSTPPLHGNDQLRRRSRVHDAEPQGEDRQCEPDDVEYEDGQHPAGKQRVVGDDHVQRDQVEDPWQVCQRTSDGGGTKTESLLETARP
jgi:hypothetical protein